MPALVLDSNASLVIEKTTQANIRAESCGRYHVAQAQTERERWHTFLYTHPNRALPAITELVSSYELARERDLPLPITTFEEAGCTSLEWNTSTLYLQIEIRDDQRIEWFFRDSCERVTASGLGCDARLFGLIDRFSAAS